MTVKVTGSTKPTGPCDYVITSWLRNSRSHLIYLCNPTKNAVIRTLAVLWTVYVHCVGGSWLPSIGFTNALCACFTHMTTGHAPIGEYWQRFFPNSSLSCPCSQAELQTRKHIVMQCGSHNPSTRPCNIIINSFVHFLVNNPMAFSFDNGWPLYAVHPQGKSTALLFPSPLLPCSPSLPSSLTCRYSFCCSYFPFQSGYYK